MNFQRNHKVEAAQVAAGIRQLESYTHQTGRVNYLICYDVMHERWTASYRVFPYKGKPVHISVGADEAIHTNAGTLYPYPTRAAAEAACRITHRELRKKLS